MSDETKRTKRGPKPHGVEIRLRWNDGEGNHFQLDTGDPSEEHRGVEPDIEKARRITDSFWPMVKLAERKR